VKARHAAIGRPLAALLLAACAFAGAAHAGPPARTEYRLDHEKAQAAYRLDSARCRQLKGNPADVCKTEARGRFQVAKADIDLKYKHSPANQDRVKLANAQAAYGLATQKCGALAGNARQVCQADAKASLAATRAEVRLNRASIDKGVYSREAASERTKLRKLNPANG
jgi:hypothetical protein